MPRNILYCDGQFIEWTTVADGPCTTPMTRTEMFDHLWRETGYPWLPEPKGMTPENREDRHADMQAEREKIERRLDRAERMGTSCMLQTEPLRKVYVQELDRDCSLIEVFASLSPASESSAGGTLPLSEKETKGED